MNEATAIPTADLPNKERVKRLLTRFDMREGLGGISDDKLYGLIRDGDLPPPLKLGTSSRWLQGDLDAFIARLAEARQPPSPPAGIRRYHEKLAADKQHTTRFLADPQIDGKPEVTP